MLFVFLAAMLTPLSLGEALLVPRFSSQKNQMKLVTAGVLRAQEKKYLLLGDSTIRNLHPSVTQIEADSETVNLGNGGGMASEWYYLMRNALRIGSSIRSVIVGMSSGESFEPTSGIPPYFPFLLDAEDVWKEYRQKRLSLSKSFLLLTYIYLKLPYVRGDVLYGFFSYTFPSMRHFMMGLLVDQVKKASSSADVPRAALKKKSVVGVEQMQRLAQERGLSLRFVLSPASSKWRENEFYLRRRKLFFDTCDDMKLFCTDLSKALPDQYFFEDGVHLKPESIGLYKSLLESLFAKDSRR